jgi:hypothetical protein
MNHRAREMERRLSAPLLIAAVLTVPAMVLEQSAGGPGGRGLATALY